MSTYAMGDLHGRYDLYLEVKKFLKPEDKVIFLGDAADRGPHGWKCIKDIYADTQFIYLMGNHEHILASAMQQMINGESHPWYSPDSLVICYYNGGGETLEAWQDEGMDTKWINRLLNLPHSYDHTTPDGYRIICSHAGFHPGVSEPDLKELIWDREHIRYDWPKEYKNLILVHGHTPIIYMKSSWVPEDGILTYADGHKINIDMSAYTNGVICLLDLDTFDEHYFSV